LLKQSLTIKKKKFYLTKEDIGKNRAVACSKRLSELNPYCKVGSITGELTADVLKQFQVSWEKKLCKHFKTVT
jgi:molybdopterin/thiamine biosynthesis adenylyltransferase